MWGYQEYVPIAKKKSDAQKQIEKLKKKDPNISPVVIEGNKIAKTWWGIAWNKNLESYADYENRIARGRSYVKNGFVLDLKIEKGVITALVQGSRSTPYKAKISISTLSDEKWNAIVAECSHKIANIEELAEGKFPEEMANLFTQKGSGIFPSPKEIKFDCSCPDWAELCKHIASVLYGVGARLDDDPTLFFKLRNVNFEVLLKKSIDEKMQNLLKNANRKTARVIDDTDISELFGV